jgi:putative endonuclease
MKTLPKHLKIGRIGEDIAVKYLIGKGFTIVDRNYRKPWGEIDVIARRDSVTHFIEVKTVERRSINGQFGESLFKPIDNVHEAKLSRLRKIIETYISAHNLGEKSFIFDIIGILYDPLQKKAKVEFMEDVVI